ncbi:hypothetical protein OBBRIDRAFT_791246 [Obba rivulosa]|uniref:BTB domain-containing protein n=1 Tax=Obba rivulosa TaxID=1052685 RepID=A0A8E2B0I2_9APHY|nr:hypothetical protein OBBRIDRAFT_791246 [Obba rivulosa]
MNRRVGTWRTRKAATPVNNGPGEEEDTTQAASASSASVLGGSFGASSLTGATFSNSLSTAKTGITFANPPSALSDAQTSAKPTSPVPAADARSNLLPSTTRLQVLQAAHKQMITTGTFVDTKIYCFSSRRTSGRVGKPLPLYANSMMLKHASAYFQAMLSETYREGDVTNLSASYPLASPAFLDDYDYESDSDFDEEEEPHYESRASARQCGIENGLSSAESCTDEADIADSTLECAIEVGETAAIEPPSVAEAFDRGRTICIQDMAYKTWQALVFYIYFGEVAFAPLKSQAGKAGEQQQAWLPSLCSPKSMYRLADKYDLGDLKTRALEDIRSKLSTENIWTELLSRFTSRYPEVQEVQIDFIMKNSTYTLSDIQHWVDLIANGDYPHSNVVLAPLIKRLLDSVSARPNALSYNGTLGSWKKY